MDPREGLADRAETVRATKTADRVVRVPTVEGREEKAARMLAPEARGAMYRVVESLEVPGVPGATRVAKAVPGEIRPKVPAAKVAQEACPASAALVARAAREATAGQVRMVGRVATVARV